MPNKQIRLTEKERNFILAIREQNLSLDIIITKAIVGSNHLEELYRKENNEILLSYQIKQYWALKDIYNNM